MVLIMILNAMKTSFERKKRLLVMEYLILLYDNEDLTRTQRMRCRKTHGQLKKGRFKEYRKLIFTTRKRRATRKF